MWYFTWLLGLGLALACGIINVMWLEANYAFGIRNEAHTLERFAKARARNKDAYIKRAADRRAAAANLPPAA